MYKQVPIYERVFNVGVSLLSHLCFQDTNGENPAGTEVSNPVSSVFQLYFQKTNDFRAQVLSNFIKYGTNNETEIWLIKYGFSFDEIEDLIDYIEKIDETEIIFKDSI